MANTNRDFKSFLCNFPPETAEILASGIPVPEPPSSTPANSKRQVLGTSPQVPVSACELVKLIDTAYLLCRSAGGATVSLVKGDMLGRRLFAVSIYPERSLEISRIASWEDLFEFVLQNVDVLAKPGHAFGVWLKAPGVYVLDVVLCVRNRRTAIDLARMFNQTSIFDLANDREIVIRARRNGIRSISTPSRQKPVRSEPFIQSAKEQLQ